MLNNSDGKHKRPQLPSIVRTDAYFDTVVLRLYSAMPSMLPMLRELKAKGQIGSWAYQRSAHSPKNRIVTLHQPSIAALRWLRRRMKVGYLVTGVAVALDHELRTQRQADELHRFLERHLCLRWHRGQRVGNDFSTDYLTPRKARRNIAGYSDKKSRTHGGFCSHLEARFRQMRPCRNAIAPNSKRDRIRLDHLVVFDQRAFWERYLWAFEIDRDVFNKILDRVVRKRDVQRRAAGDGYGTLADRKARLEMGAFYRYRIALDGNAWPGKWIDEVKVQVWRNALPEFRDALVRLDTDHLLP